MFYNSDITPQWPPIMNAFSFTSMLIIMELFLIWKSIRTVIELSLHVNLISLEMPAYVCCGILSCAIVFSCYLYKKKYKKKFLILDNENVIEFKKKRNKVLLYWVFIAAPFFSVIIYQKVK